MRRIKTLYILLLLTVAGLTSCLSSSDDETTLYGEAAISSFSIGTLNRQMHTTSSTGEDSVYTTTVTGNSYSFVIDQTEHRIFNPDSLPLGTDVAHVLVTLSTYNSGLTVIKDVASDTLRYYNSTDSIDFTEPRQFLVYSNDGTGSTTYTVSVNVRQQDPEQFVWTLIDDGTQPDHAASIQEFPVEGIKLIIGSSTRETYALSDDNHLMVWRDGSTAWQEDLLDDDASLLPTEDVSMVCYPMAKTVDTDYVLMAGNRSLSQYPQEATARVWRKIVDNGTTVHTERWTYIERPANALYQLPRMEHLALIKYDDGVLAFGAPYTAIYQSRDNGITWKTNATYQMPDGFDCAATSVSVKTDSDNYIWLYCHGTGQVWRGRLNRLASAE